MTDSELEDRLFTYLWLSLHTPNAHAGPGGPTYRGSERRGQAGMVERARLKAETTPGGPRDRQGSGRSWRLRVGHAAFRRRRRRAPGPYPRQSSRDSLPGQVILPSPAPAVGARSNHCAQPLVDSADLRYTGPHVPPQQIKSSDWIEEAPWCGPGSFARESSPPRPSVRWQLSQPRARLLNLQANRTPRRGLPMEIRICKVSMTWVR